MLSAPVTLLLLAMVIIIRAAPSNHEGYQMTEKRAALVLDRLLVALRNALDEDQEPGDGSLEVIDQPRALPLRYEPPVEVNNRRALQRRGQATPNTRGRVLRCYFNAITCF